MTKQVLDDVERVLDPGPHLRQRALHRLGPIPQVFRQCLDDAALDRDVPVDIAVLKFGPLVRPGIAGIGEDSLLPAVQQGRRLVDVGFVGGGARDRVHHPRGDITPICAFIPKCHWLPFLVWCISGSRALLLFLVEDGAAMIVASTIVPWRISRPRSSSIADTSANNAWLNSCRSSQWRKFRIVVSSGTPATVRSMPATPRKAWLSYSASSIAPSASPYHCCRKWIRSIRSRPIGGRPRSP